MVPPFSPRTMDTAVSSQDDSIAKRTATPLVLAHRSALTPTKSALEPEISRVIHRLEDDFFGIDISPLIGRYRSAHHRHRAFALIVDHLHAQLAEP